MPAKKFLRVGTGNELFDEVAGVQSSAGAGNAGDIPALDEAGKLDSSMMPSGIGADTTTATCSENLASGDLVNLWNNAGTINARKADAASTGKTADGFVTQAWTSGQTVTVFHDGSNAMVTGLTPGKQYLSASTPGKSTATKPVGSGNIQQVVGLALTATLLTFEAGDTTIKLA